MINGGGYPVFRYARDCHQASKLVHVCDVYDALRTRRPYREAWSFEKTLGYLEERSGLEFDPELSGAFVRMMKQWEGNVSVLPDAQSPVAAPSAPPPASPAANPPPAQI
jgi:HD-GYP domain-containing protein (c-di-GMP phosphodiesterase class II)